MIITDMKNALTTIMAKRHPDGKNMSTALKPQKVMDERGDVAGKHIAAQDMIAAMYDKDAQKYAEAWTNMHELHMADKDTEPKVPEQPEKES